MNRIWFNTLAVFATFGSMSLMAPAGWCVEPATQTPTANQPMTKEAVEAWLRARIERPMQPDLRNTQITFRIENPYTLSDDDLEAMRKRIEGKPDHPERRLVQIYERRKKFGPDVIQLTGWRGGADQWAVVKRQVFKQAELEMSRSEFPTAWLFARNHDTDWMLDDASRVVVTAAHDDARKYGPNPKEYAQAVESFVLRCIRAGTTLVNLGENASLRLDLELLGSNHWRARVWSSAFDPPRVTVLEGVWINDLPRLSSSGREITGQQWATHPGTERVFSEYRWIAEWNTWIPMRCSSTGDDNRPQDRGERVVIEDIAFVNQDAIDRIASIPKPGDIIPIFGIHSERTVTVVDVKPLDQAMFETINPANSQARFGPGSGKPDQESLNGVLRYAGWSLMIIVPGVFICVWWAKRASRRINVN